MRRTIGRMACLVTVAVTLAACDPAVVTTPAVTLAVGVADASTPPVIVSDTSVRRCPEVSIPENYCISR